MTQVIGNMLFQKNHVRRTRHVVTVVIASPAISSVMVLLIVRTEATNYIAVRKLSLTAPMEGVLNGTHGVMGRTTAEITVMKINVQVTIISIDLQTIHLILVLYIAGAIDIPSRIFENWF